MRKTTSLIMIGLLGAAMALIYQNCGDQLPTSLYSSSKSSNEIYEVKVDQLAYMSCSEQENVPNDQNVFFTFRVGAYGDNAGLHLTDDFLYKHRGKKKAAMMNLLMNDFIFGGSQIQFSLRKQSDLGLMFIGPSGNEGTEGVDYDFTLGSLGSEEMSASLLTTNTEFNGWLNYWAPAGISSDAYFEGTMTFNESEIVANQVRNFFTSGGGVLTAGFSDPTEPKNLRLPDYSSDDDRDNDDNSVPANIALGRGLKLTFRQPQPLNWGYSGAANVNMPKRVLASVVEYDLASPGRSSGVWDCPTRMQFRVFYPSDAGPSSTSVKDSNGNTLCDMQVDPGVVTGDLAIVRNSLPASDWYVDMTKKCVVPRRSTVGSCYGIDAGTQQTRRVSYNPTNFCNQVVVNASGDTCGHFISICMKTQ